MANLRDETIITVLNLQRRLLLLINEATASGFIILEQYGETEFVKRIDELQKLFQVA